MANPIAQALQGQVEGPAKQSGTPLLDALIARGLKQPGAQEQLALSPTPLEGFPTLPNPDPGSPPPLYGEPPGEGYLYARDPAFRQAALIHTDPEIVRTMLLRAMEVLATNLLLPFNEEKAVGNADAILKLAQSYLLIDPSVDAEGVPVAMKAALSAAGQAAGAAGSPQPGGQAHGQVKKGANVGGHAQPPRVVPGAAAQAIEQMHEHAEEVLQGARGSRPLPRPRPSS